MIAYLRSIWRCRYFWFNLVRMDLRTRYRRSVLGMGWSLLHPIAMTVIFCLVFQHLMMPEEGVARYAPYLLAGLATWNFILTATMQGCHCFLLGEVYIRQYPAPLAIYPLRTALGAMIHFLIALTVVLALAWTLHGFGNLPVLWWLVPGVLLLFLFTWSMAILSGVANVYFQDTQHLCEVGFQVLLYLTPVFYPASMLQRQGLGWMAVFNPLASLLDLIRVPILDGRPPSVFVLSVACGLTVAAAGGAIFTLHRCQRKLIFQL
jgi:ABC-type polysaccharide/polyol phosphate export permease